MKKFLIAVLIELIVIAIASVLMYYVWNHMAANYFHYKDVNLTQAVMITSLFRVLILKLD